MKSEILELHPLSQKISILNSFGVSKEPVRLNLLKIGTCIS